MLDKTLTLAILLMNENQVKTSWYGIYLMIYTMLYLSSISLNCRFSHSCSQLEVALQKILQRGVT